MSTRTAPWYKESGVESKWLRPLRRLSKIPNAEPGDEGGGNEEDKDDEEDDREDEGEKNGGE